MNIEPDIFDYLKTTSLEPHDDYTSEITYKDQKIIWNRLQQLQQELDQYKNNWEELKTYLKMAIGMILNMSFNINNDQLSQQTVDDYIKILNKMKELEEKNGKN